MKQWARLYDKPLSMTHQSVVTYAGPYVSIAHIQCISLIICTPLIVTFLIKSLFNLQRQTLTRGANPGSFYKHSKHEKTTRVVPSSVSPPPSLSNEVVSRPSRDAEDGDTLLLELPSWTPLVVSDSEGSVDRLPLPGAEDAPSSTTTSRRKMSQKRQKIADYDPPTVAVPQREIQQASSRIPGAYSKSRDSRSSPSLQEVLQATFSANGSYNISPPVTPIDSEGSSTDVPTGISTQQRLLIKSTRRSTSQQDSAAITVVDALLPNAPTTVLNTAPQKAAPPIRYESIQKAIDAALDTRVAKITWRRRRHATGCSTNQKSQDGTPMTKHFPFKDAIFDFDVPTSAHQRDHRNDFKSGLAVVEDEHRALPRKFTRMLNRVQTAAVPHQSRGEKFNERLDAMFGGAEGPHSLHGLITRATADSASVSAPAREVAAGKALSPVSSSDSGTSINTSLSQSTKATSVSGRNDVSRKRTYAESHLVDEPDRKKQKFHITEDQVLEWIAALQRLVKGKTKIYHKGMEDLSIVLAEIESVYPHLDSELAPVTCLQDVLQQLAQLEDIPFRDEHNLRHRADHIIAEWRTAKA
ncbi:hypothetical protein DFH29DRAFT_933940 [Suillus ampliporus]|nr:hypothetical protein DFH29DRAFT_933940 [Suillus ampliporus]